MAIARILQCDRCYQSVARGAQPRMLGGETRRADARGSIRRVRLGSRTYAARSTPVSADLCGPCQPHALELASRAAESARRYGAEFLTNERLLLEDAQAAARRIEAARRG